MKWIVRLLVFALGFLSGVCLYQDKVIQAQKVNIRAGNEALGGCVEKLISCTLQK